MLILAAASCGRGTEPTERPTSTVPVESPSSAESTSPSVPTVSPSPPVTIEVGSRGFDAAPFGRSMRRVVPLLVELLGAPVYDDRMHGDLPLGY